MGCRPSKQATSKVRAVEHQEESGCLCSPVKLRKHKCSSATSHRRTSAGSARESKSNIFSAGHRPMSLKSADLDFPAFSTTTAIYRTSASKTSKITLRLSCDGSTLQIEQCDYDLEKVGGEGEPKPRPWNSAPNLSRLRDSKSRLFRDSCLPIKHSASGWSPSTISAASGGRGGLIRVPVLINTQVESASSAGNMSQNCSVLPHNTSQTSRDKVHNSSHTFFEPSTFCAKTFGKAGLGKSLTSHQFSSGDERRPLLLDILRDSKQTSMEGNINKAVSPALQDAGQRDTTPPSSSEDKMMDALESTLGVAPHVTSPALPESSVSVRSRDHVTEKTLHGNNAHISSCGSNTSFQSTDLQLVPASRVIPSCVTCQGQAVPGTEMASNFYPLLPSPDIFYLSDQSVTRSCNEPLSTKSIYNQLSTTESCGQAEHSHPAKKNYNSDLGLRNGLSGVKLSESVWNRDTAQKEQLSKQHNTLGRIYSTIHVVEPVSTDTGSLSGGTLLSGLVVPQSKTDQMLAPEIEELTSSIGNSFFMLPTSGEWLLPLDTKEIDFSSMSSCECTPQLEGSFEGSDAEDPIKIGSCDLDWQESKVFIRSDEVENIEESCPGRCSFLDSNHDRLFSCGAVPSLQESPRLACPNMSPTQENGLCHPWCHGGSELTASSRRFDQQIEQQQYRCVCQNLKDGWDGYVDLSFLPRASLGLGDRLTWGEKRLVSSWSDGETEEEFTLDLPQVGTRGNGQYDVPSIGSSSKWASHCLHSRGSESLSGSLSGRCLCGLSEDTRNWHRVNDAGWGVDRNLDMEERIKERQFSAREGFQDWRELNILEDGDSSQEEEDDYCSEDAGYLVRLLLPDHHALGSSSHASESSFSFDLDCSYDGALSLSSTSNNSDQGISPTTGSVLGQSVRFEQPESGQHERYSENEATDQDPSLTSVQLPKATIMHESQARTEPCDWVHYLTSCPSVRAHIDKSGALLSDQVPKTCLVSQLSQKGDGPLLIKSRLLSAETVNSFRGSSDIHRNIPGYQGSNGNEDRPRKILLDDVSADKINDVGNGSGRNDETRKNVSEGSPHSHPYNTNNGNSLPGLYDGPEKPRNNSRVLSAPACQETLMDPRNGVLLIETNTSGRVHPRQIPGSSHSQGTIDPTLNVSVLGGDINSCGHVRSQEQLLAPGWPRHLNNVRVAEILNSREASSCDVTSNEFQPSAKNVDLRLCQKVMTSPSVQDQIWNLAVNDDPDTEGITVNIVTDVWQSSVSGLPPQNDVSGDSTGNNREQTPPTTHPDITLPAVDAASLQIITNSCTHLPEITALEQEHPNGQSTQITSTTSMSMFSDPGQQKMAVQILSCHQNGGPSSCIRQATSKTCSNNLVRDSNCTRTENTCDRSDSSSNCATSSCIKLIVRSPVSFCFHQPPEVKQNGGLDSKSSAVTMATSKQALPEPCYMLTNKQTNWQTPNTKGACLTTNPSDPKNPSLGSLFPDRTADKQLSEENGYTDCRPVTRTNVLSLVRYFEKVPFIRHEAKS